MVTKYFRQKDLWIGSRFNIYSNIIQPAPVKYRSCDDGSCADIDVAVIALGAAHIKRRGDIRMF